MNVAGRTRRGLAILGILAAIASAGCTSTVRLPASEILKLPAAEGQEAKLKEWPVVHTVEGEKRTLCGTVESVGIEQPGGVSRLFPPFAARIEGETLVVRDALGARAFRMADVIAVNVEYENRKVPRTVLGASLVTVGAPLFGVGVFALVAGLASDGELSQGAVVAGLLSMTLGAAAAGPGISFLATDPSPPGEDVSRMRPIIRIGPGGASISTVF